MRKVCFSVSIELPAHDCKEGEIKAKKGEKIKFKLKPSKEFTNKIDGWDWIGVYSEQEAVKLKDYCSSKYVTSSDWSKSRLKMEPKEFKLSNPSSSASSGEPALNYSWYSTTVLHCIL